MWRQITTIWKYRSFLLSLVSMDLRTRYRRSILGVGWSLMNPIMMTIVFCAVFAKWNTVADWRVFGPSFLCGMTLFEFVKSSALGGCSTFSRNESYIRQCPLPLALYNLRTVMGAAIHYLIALVVVILCIFILQHDNIPKVLEVMWVLIPSFIMLFVFCWSISVIASFMTVYFHDIQHLLEVFFQVFFFLTPIMYTKKDLLEKGPWGKVLLQFNPIVTFFELIREPLTDPAITIPTLWCFSKALIVTGIFFTMAIGTIRALEPKLIFHL